MSEEQNFKISTNEISILRSQEGKECAYEKQHQFYLSRT